MEGKDEIGSFECWLTKGDAVFGLEEADAARQEERARSSSMLLAAALTAEDEAAREADLQVSALIAHSSHTCSAHPQLRPLISWSIVTACVPRC